MSKGIKISLDLYKKLNEEHLAGKSIKELCKENKLRWATLYYGFKNNNLTILKATNLQKKRIDCNHNFFSDITTEIQAYLLGWIMSDGCINKRKEANKSSRLAIKLQERDIEILELFKNYISPNQKLTKDKSQFRRKTFQALKFETVSTPLVEDLIKLGVNYNKTINGENIPNISQELLRHFVRGFFDGDGSISITKRNRSSIYICSINKEFLENLDKLLIQDNIKIETSIYTELRGTFKTMYRLSIKDRKLFFKYLYEGSNFKLSRKFEKYNYVNTVLIAKEKKLATV